MATGIGNDGLQTAISLTGLVTTIANGATQASGAFTIPYVTGASSALCNAAHLQLVCTSFTPSASPAFLQGVFITEDDGANYDDYWVSNLQLYPIDDTLFQAPLEAVATTLVKRKGLILPATLAATATAQLVLFNNSGVSITVSSASLFPYGETAG